MSDTLRQAINKLEIIGVVKEQRLNAGSSDNGEYINGSLVIKAGEFTEVEVKVFVNEKTKEGKTRKVYETLQSILNGDFKTLADGVPEEEAVKVRIWGNDDFAPQFKEEMYVSENKPNEVTTRIVLDLGFGNVTINNNYTPDKYKAEFDVEMYVTSVEEEEKDEKMTGRAIIKGYVPAYGGTVFPLTIIAGMVEDEEGEYDFGEEVLNNIQEGDTVRLWGRIDYKAIITKKKIGGSLGRAKIEESRTYVNELNAIGGDLIDDEEKIFDEELIKKAVKERETKKDEVLERAKEDKGNNKSKKKRGNVGKDGVRNRNKNASEKSSSQEDDDDWPF